MTDLNKARKWANTWSDTTVPAHTRAAVDIIQSLPDRWVDVEKVQEIIADMDLCLKMESTSDFSKGIDNATTSWRDALKALIVPKLPTLADMTEEEREACQWMQARVEGEGYDSFVIASMGEQFTKVLRPDGLHEVKGNGQVTPLPDLPKLQWPGGVVDCEIVEEPEPAESCSIHTPMQPSEVPADELWFVSTPFADGVGYRHPDQSYPWFVIYPSLAERKWHVWEDSQITLIHKLVPEPPALPEGMRLADHEEYGRVVVSPETDQDDDHLAFYSDKNIEYGVSWAYVKECEFTFLDGEA